MKRDHADEDDDEDDDDDDDDDENNDDNVVVNATTTNYINAFLAAQVRVLIYLLVYKNLIHLSCRLSF